MPRLLYVPMYTSPKHLATDSTYNWSKVFFRRIVEYDPKAFVYFPVPEGCENDYAEIEHARIYKFPVPMVGNQYMESSWVQEIFHQKFSDVFGRYCPDIVVCDKACVIPSLKLGLDIWSPKARPPKVYVSKTLFIFDHDEIEWVSRDFEMNQSLGYAMADRILWKSDADYARGFKIAQRYLSASMLGEMARSKFLGGYIPNFAACEPHYHDPMTKPSSPRLLNYAYGGNADYHVTEVLEAFDLTFKTTSNVGVLITCPTVYSGRHFQKALKGKEYAELHLGLSQAEYLSKIKNAHVFIYYPSRPGTMSGAVIEQQLLGLVGVFPADDRKPVSLYPDYPYVFRDKRELFHLTRYLIEHYYDPEVQRVIETQRAFVQRYDPRVDAVRIYEECLRLLREKTALFDTQASRIKTELIELLREGTMSLPEVDLDQVLTLMRRHSKYGNLNLNNIQTLAKSLTSPAQVRTLMRHIGFEDMCDGAAVRFRRIGDGDGAVQEG